MTNDKLQISMEPVERCPLCRSAQGKERIRVEIPGGGEAVFSDCAECGLAYMNPAPTKQFLDEFYKNVYLTPEYRTVEGFDIPDPRQELVSTTKYMEHVANEVEDYRTPPGRWLDVGSAYGGLILEAATRGWDAEGIEPFGEAVNFCRDSLNLRVVQGDIAAADLPKEAFDVITMMEVLEHFDRPVQAMMRISKLAKPGSLLMLTTPNPNSPAALLTKGNWIGWKPPTHVCLFDFHSVRLLLERTGWKPLRIKACGIYPGQLIVFAEKTKR